MRESALVQQGWPGGGVAIDAVHTPNRCLLLLTEPHIEDVDLVGHLSME
jgi:hypothetical protein